MPTNLPNLTPDQKTAVGILLVSREPLDEVAALCGMSLLEFVELCSDPGVQAHIDAARALARKRADHVAQDARTAAIETLQQIAETPASRAPDTDRLALIHAIERRRAATTILRAANPARTPHRIRRPRHAAPPAEPSSKINEPDLASPDFANPAPPPSATAPDAERASTPTTKPEKPTLADRARPPRQTPQENSRESLVDTLATTAGLASRPPNSWP